MGDGAERAKGGEEAAGGVRALCEARRVEKPRRHMHTCAHEAERGEGYSPRWLFTERAIRREGYGERGMGDGAEGAEGGGEAAGGARALREARRVEKPRRHVHTCAREAERGEGYSPRGLFAKRDMVREGWVLERRAQRAAARRREARARCARRARAFCGQADGVARGHTSRRWRWRLERPAGWQAAHLGRASRRAATAWSRASLAASAPAPRKARAPSACHAAPPPARRPWQPAGRTRRSATRRAARQTFVGGWRAPWELAARGGEN